MFSPHQGAAQAQGPKQLLRHLMRQGQYNVIRTKLKLDGSHKKNNTQYKLWIFALDHISNFSKSEALNNITSDVNLWGSTGEQCLRLIVVFLDLGIGLNLLVSDE